MHTITRSRFHPLTPIRRSRRYPEMTMSPTRATTPAHPDASPGRVSDAPDRERFDVAGKQCFLIGIGGCGMSGLARMLARRGAIVSGADMQRSDVTDGLTDEGIPVVCGAPGGEDAGLPRDCDLVIASAAVKPDHPQLLAAQSRGTPTLTYAEALGRCMLGRTGVALAGTHGKSTTAAMLGVALARAGLDPTVIVGAVCTQLSEGRPGPPAGFRLGAETIPAGSLKGRPGLLIGEACEFNRSFHNLRPVVGAISAVEADHLDIYGSLDAVIQSFHEFAALIPPARDGGRLLISHEGAHRREVTAGLECAVETIGFAPGADWVVSFDPETMRVELEHAGETVGAWTMRQPGEHNAMNSAFAAALAITLGADPLRVGEALSDFRGVDRRVQLLGEKGGVRVYDDYGHHPTEIEATLRALRQYEKPQEKGGRLICVFQPHQHSRTRFLMEEFAQSFTQADVVIVPHIYFVRDSEIEKTKVSAGDLVDRLRERGVRAMHLYPFGAIVEQLENICRPGDLLVVMGAGPVWQVARGFLEAGIGHQASGIGS
ncbi:MAG: UDP-N-acetylmuramate--L-alanine ligase [Phycisphaeraceae bacterium]|nr:MAG: UDP-N-acetylmuramate--L-alanine ligase [Phycisphaeraceae bacterium]